MRHNGKLYPGLVEEAKDAAFKAMWVLSHRDGHSAVFVAFMDRVVEMVGG